LGLPGQADTFKDLVREEIVLPLRLYTQHFFLRKPQKYTHPHKTIANFFTIAVAKGRNQADDFGSVILKDLIQ